MLLIQTFTSLTQQNKGAPSTFINVLCPPQSQLYMYPGMVSGCVVAGFEKSTRPLAFASALPGRASRILASLARPGERFPPGPKW